MKVVWQGFLGERTRSPAGFRNMNESCVTSLCFFRGRRQWPQAISYPPTPSGVCYQMCSLDAWLSAAAWCRMPPSPAGCWEPLSPAALLRFAANSFFSLLLGATKPPKKLIKNPTVGTVTTVVTVTTVGIAEAFDPNIYSVLAHAHPSAAPVVRYLLCLSTCAPGVGAHGGSR